MTKWVKFYPLNAHAVAVVFVPGDGGKEYQYTAASSPRMMRKKYGGPVAVVREKEKPLDGRKLGCH